MNTYARGVYITASTNRSVIRLQNYHVYTTANGQENVKELHATKS